MKDLTGKVVVVTGGSAGLGEQIALTAACYGATVVVCARHLERVEQVRSECTKLAGTPCYGYQTDLGQPESIDRLLVNLAADVGDIDILVNCAGFGLFENFIDMSYATIEKMFAVNVLGLMYLTKSIAVQMAEAHHGHIINIGSQAGKMATPKSAVYSATKFAVVGFSNGLRLELKPFNVQVTTVNPGPINTEFFDKADPEGNYLAKMQWLVLDPRHLARRIVASFTTNKREINAPWFMEGAGKMYTLFPHVGDFLAGGLFNRK